MLSSLTDAQGGRTAALAFGTQLASIGYLPDVFHSDFHASLRSGYWVTATGRYDDEDSAASLALLLKSMGFDIAYQRCVGDVPPCPPAPPP